ncbi:PDZ domain-containing protein [bacterium]|nr:PDZ domain-containing protein [bacterium]
MALTLKKEQDTKSKKVNTEVTNRSVYAAASVIVALLLFASGWAFGRGNIGITSLSSGAVRGNIQNFNEVNEVVKALRDNYDGAIDDTKLMDSLKSGAAKSAGDPYTEFFNSEDSKAFSDELSGSFEGIGAELGKDGNNIVIITPIAGSPAEKAGLKSKDIIVKIDDTQATDMSIAEAVKLINNEVATLIGETSYGKGSVQQIIDLSAGGTLKVTIARWFTPNDKNIDKEGIKPDQEVKISDQDIKNGVDPQIDAAKAYLK